MAKRVRIHYAFSAGEADPQYERRNDWEAWINSLKSARNVRLLNGGGMKRRPGLARVATLAGRGRFVPFTAVDGSKRLVILEPAAYRVMEPDETFETTVASGMAWASGDLDALQADSENNDITIASRSFWPKVLTRTLAGSWSVGDLAFATRGDASKAQPYYRFPETKDIAITPSATSGAGITLAASAAVFDSDHVGASFLLYDREVAITAYTNATTVTATVIQTLYPTLEITVGSTTGFAVGDQVSTSVEEIDGEVVEVTSATVVKVTTIGSFSTPTTTTNNLVGPNASSAISAVTSASPGPVGQWKEQMIGVHRGYPGGTCYHRGRRCLFNFASAPDVFEASAQDVTDDFDLGTALDSDAIEAKIGDAIGQTIRHGVSTEQLILLTDVGPYYVGEGPGTPFTPTTVDFLDIGPEPAADCNPVKSAEGVIYVDREVTRLMVLAPTGNVRRSWETGDLSDLAPHLLDGISRMCLIDGCEWGAERYIVAINSEGNLALMHYRRGQEVLGWAPWDTDGDFIDICKFNNKVYVIVLRGSTYYLERFDEDRLLDDSLLASGTSSITNAHWASATREVVWRETVSGEARRASLGDFTADGSGVISGLEAEARDYEVGRPFTLTAQLWPPVDPDRPFNSPTRLSRVIIDLVESGHFTANGSPVTPYDYGDDQEELPPLRTRQARVAVLGVRWDHTLTLQQVIAAPLQIRMIVVEAG